jgi:hypothetical protein
MINNINDDTSGLSVRQLQQKILCYCRSKGCKAMGGRIMSHGVHLKHLEQDQYLIQQQEVMNRFMLEDQQQEQPPLQQQQQSLHLMKKLDLVAMCKRNGLVSCGSKDELIERLESFSSSSSSSSSLSSSSSSSSFLRSVPCHIVDEVDITSNVSFSSPVSSSSSSSSSLAAPVEAAPVIAQEHISGILNIMNRHSIPITSINSFLNYCQRVFVPKLTEEQQSQVPKNFAEIERTINPHVPTFVKVYTHKHRVVCVCVCGCMYVCIILDSRLSSCLCIISWSI